MAGPAVSIQVVDTAYSPSGNTYNISFVASTGDVSGLRNFSMSWSGVGLPPLYTIGSIQTLQLP
jgi:hypothetical protein